MADYDSKTRIERMIPCKFVGYPTNVLYLSYKRSSTCTTISQSEFLSMKLWVDTVQRIPEEVSQRTLDSIEHLDTIHKDIIELRFKEYYPLEKIGLKYNITDSRVGCITRNTMNTIANYFIYYIITGNSDIFPVPADQRLNNLDLTFEVLLYLFRMNIFRLSDLVNTYYKDGYEGGRNGLMDVPNIGKIIYDNITTKLRDRGLLDTDVLPWKYSTITRWEIANARRA